MLERWPAWRSASSADSIQRSAGGEVSFALFSLRAAFAGARDIAEMRIIVLRIVDDPDSRSPWLRALTCPI
jgi:hypothetical protein